MAKHGKAMRLTSLALFVNKVEKAHVTIEAGFGDTRRQRDHIGSKASPHSSSQEFESESFRTQRARNASEGIVSVRRTQRAHAKLRQVLFCIEVYTKRHKKEQSSTALSKKPWPHGERTSTTCPPRTSIYIYIYERRTKLLVDLFSHGMTLNLC